MRHIHIKSKILSFLFAALLSVGHPAQAAEKLRMVFGEDGIALYAKGVLKIILSKLPDKYEWDESTPTATEARITQMLVDNQLDIIWYATTRDFEDRMQPIRIPIYKGLFGYRVLMIKRGNQYKFDGIHTINDLKRITIAQGRGWADSDILEANGINVLKVTQYQSLFYMLDGDRYDAFPRGVHEPWAEMKRFPDLALDVEKHLLIAYPNAFYFFVNKNNKELAEKVERGFRIAIEDGSFDKYFFSDPTVNDVMRNADLAHRELIRLRNPLLPEATPINDKTLWFDPTQLQPQAAKDF